MSRQSLSKSISFDPVVFDLMEDARRAYGMERSEFVKHCILNGINRLKYDPTSLVAPLSPELKEHITTHSSRTAEGREMQKKSKRKG